jgi:hypothetical protein
MSTSDFSPDHRALPRIFANPKESQLPEITQLLFQSGSYSNVPKLADELDSSRHDKVNPCCRLQPIHGRGAVAEANLSSWGMSQTNSAMDALLVESRESPAS